MAQIHMHRDDLEGLGAISLPDGYSLRVATAQDAIGLAGVLQKSFPEMEWDVDRAKRELLENLEVENTWVIDFEGEIVATASARNLHAPHEDVGYVHWVGADSDHKGKGLGRAINLAVLQDFVDHGKTSAILDTDAWRIPAIGVYFALGFEPTLGDAEDRAQWRGVFETLGRPIPLDL